MKSGPKPKPTALKILAGNPGRRPLNEREPQPKVCVPRPPKHLTAAGRKLWRAIGKRLANCGILTDVDATAFELLISSYVEYCEASAKVSQSGPVWLDKGDGKIPKFAYSPYWVQMNKAAKRMHTMLREFGMTPSARSAIKSAGPIVEQNDDMLDLIQRHYGSKAN
jgi:P27 family predicted phage terminase small subunit